MKKSLELFAKQLVKNVEKQPGWIPLLVLTWVIVELADLQTELILFGRTLTVSSELIAGVGAFALYQVGDALDKAIFKPAAARLLWLEDARANARKALTVNEGVYAVAKSVAVASGDFWQAPIHVRNEAAKFLRSLSLPLVAAGVYFLLSGWLILAVLSLLFGLISIPLFILLKAGHMRSLYDEMRELRKKPEYDAQDLNGVRLFFWEGEMVASALRVYPCVG
jgi:hypothetical protein